MKTRTKWIAVPATLAAAAVAGYLFIEYRLRATKPEWDGKLALAGLHGEVEILRDSAGRPSIRSNDAHDAYFTLGFVEAQDRFFQMDRARRRAAGELASLDGKPALAQDLRNRVHEFRKRALARIQTLDTKAREILEAYREGINAGLANLGSRPWHYQVLGVKPAPWELEDTLLVDYDWYLRWQSKHWAWEVTRTGVRDRLGSAFLQFLTRPGSGVPGPKILNLQVDETAEATSEEVAAGVEDFLKRYVQPTPDTLAVELESDQKRTSITGRYGKPDSDWYPVQLQFQGTAVSGLTLPGYPVFPVGTSGALAWASAYSEADTADTVMLPRLETDPEIYTYGGKTKVIERLTVALDCRGEAPLPVEILRSDFGPIVGRGFKNQYLALQWTAYDAEAVDLKLLSLPEARDSGEAAALLQGAGIPNARFLVVDQAGTRVESRSGKVPLRFGFEGDLPVSWSFGDRGWKGVVSESQLQTAENRPAGALNRLENVADDPNIGRWEQVLKEAGARGVGSVGDVLAAKDAFQAFRARTIAQLFAPILGRCLEEPAFQPGLFDLDSAALALLESKPSHLLIPHYGDWDALLSEAVKGALHAKPADRGAPIYGGWRGRWLSRLEGSPSGAGQFTLVAGAGPGGTLALAAPVSDQLTDRVPAGILPLAPSDRTHQLSLRPAGAK